MGATSTYNRSTIERGSGAKANAHSTSNLAHFGGKNLKERHLQTRTPGVWCGVLVFAISVLLYLATLAPGVTWGDSAKLATMTNPLELTVEAGCHTLRNIIGVAFNFLPCGDVAFRQNAMSAFFGALTCMLTFLLVRRLAAGLFCDSGRVRSVTMQEGPSRSRDSRFRGNDMGDAPGNPAASGASATIAGLCAATALCFSHVFWLVSVITESYTLFTALLAGVVFLILKHLDEGRPVWLWLAGLLLGLSYMNSVLMFALTPALVLLVILVRRGLRSGSGTPGSVGRHAVVALLTQSENSGQALPSPPCEWERENGGRLGASSEGEMENGECPSTPCERNRQGRPSGPASLKTYFIAILLLVVGYIPMAVIFVSMLGEKGNTFRRLLELLFDWRYSGLLFIYSPAACLKGCAKYVAVLFYQFPVLGFLLGCVGLAVYARRSWRVFVPLALIFLLIVLFTSTYMEQRRYYVMVGSFWVFAVWIGIGSAYVLEKSVWFKSDPSHERERAVGEGGPLAHARSSDLESTHAEKCPAPASAGTPARRRCIVKGLTLLILLAALPAGLYYNVLAICRAFDQKPLGNVRTVAYRDVEKFFLVPDKRGCDGAERFAREVFAIVPQNSVVVADFTPGAVLGYFQTVRGLRRDVQVVSPEGRDMLRYIDSVSPERPLFMVGGHKAYEEDLVQTKYLLVRVGPILQVVRQ